MRRIVYKGPLIKITSQLSLRGIKAVEPSVCTTNHTLFASKRVAYSLCGLKVQPAWETPSNHLLPLSATHGTSKQPRKTTFPSFYHQLMMTYSYMVLLIAWMVNTQLSQLYKLFLKYYNNNSRPRKSVNYLVNVR